ncbi:MAG: molecular chaperone TorD family protein [Alphaproteobacteria bacterium]
MTSAGVPATEALLAHAAAWRLASLLLERPRPQWRTEITQLAAEVDAPKLRCSAAETEQATEELYHRLFGPGGAVSPREVSYCGLEDPGQVMAQLASFYQAFSFTPRREESIDHISVEAGFVGYLFLKEAYAELQGDAEAGGITKDARERFIHEHLQRCTQGIVDRLSDSPLYLKKVLSWLAATKCDPAP